MADTPTPNLLGQGTWIAMRCGFCNGRIYMVDLNELCWDECSACGAADFGDGWERPSDD